MDKNNIKRRSVWAATDSTLNSWQHSICKADEYKLMMMMMMMMMVMMMMMMMMSYVNYNSLFVSMSRAKYLESSCL